MTIGIKDLKYYFTTLITEKNILWGKKAKKNSHRSESLEKNTKSPQLIF